LVLKKQSLEGKVAIVTGGGTNLGKAYAIDLAREGADIVVAGRRADLIERTAKEVRDLGRKGIAIQTDLTDSQQVDSLVYQTLAEMGKIDILINNAGKATVGEKPFWDITDEEWYSDIDANLSSVFFCCRTVGKHMVARKSGRIINVTSPAGLRGGRYALYTYGIAKSALIQLTRSLAKNWAKDNVQVNCIVPAHFSSPDSPTDPLLTVREENKAFPLGTTGLPSDISSLVLFLVSDASSYITGGLFYSDGGLLAGGHAPTGYAPIMAIKED
jgi:NAD(P)-dependent dehydrogenase (short-subunit alcohol dehydrogenase family)